MTILGVDILTMAATLTVWAFFGIPIKNAVLGVWRKVSSNGQKAG